jgi:hypothetical protein
MLMIFIETVAGCAVSHTKDVSTVWSERSVFKFQVSLANYRSTLNEFKSTYELYDTLPKRFGSLCSSTCLNVSFPF